jgi:hypothetical protein
MPSKSKTSRTNPFLKVRSSSFSPNDLKDTFPFTGVEKLIFI